MRQIRSLLSWNILVRTDNEQVNVLKSCSLETDCNADVHPGSLLWVLLGTTLEGEGGKRDGRDCRGEVEPPPQKLWNCDNTLELP